MRTSPAGPAVMISPYFWRIMRRLLAPAMILSVYAGNTFGWDTQEDKIAGWKSTYLYIDADPRPGAWDQFHRDEHTEFAYIVLRGLLGKQYDRYLEPLSVIDLNSSLLRPELSKLGTSVGTVPRTVLDERRIPPPHSFAGLPDYSYTMYDWINKNAICPSLPKGVSQYQRCHDFKGWMGVLNSTHFGSQTAGMYQRIHRIALALGKEAKAVREALQELPSNEQKAYRDYFREAELMALAFEGYAQHYNHDRWSSGHMWERWNSGSYYDLPNKGVVNNAIVAGASGLLHGSESIFGKPDPVSSPWLTTDRSRIGVVWPSGVNKAAAPALWQHCPKGICSQVDNYSARLFPGVGDERLVDLLDGAFGKEYKELKNKDYPLRLERQREQFTACAEAGWVEVIREFGQAKGGGYGFHGLTLPADAKDFHSLRHGCWDMWLTNESVGKGWEDLSFGEAARLLAFAPGVAVGAGLDARKDWLRVTWRIWRHSTFDPYSSTLAMGGIGNFGDTQHGGMYDLPEYLEPEDLRDLPEEVSKTGSDQLTINGFFNRGSIRFWCSDVDSRLQDLRGTGDEMKNAACAYLSTLLYKGTDPAYKGSQRELRRMDEHWQSPPIDPVCAAFRPVPDHYTEELPWHIHPGYVKSAHDYAKGGLWTESVANWCEQVPVLDLVADSTLRDLDVVGEVQGADSGIELSGLNLGDKAGILTLVSMSGGNAGRVVIDGWSERHINFHVSGGLSDGDYLVSVTRTDGTQSVGRFLLRVSEMPEEIDLELGTPPDPDTGVTWQSSIGDCSDLRNEWHKKCGEMAERYKRERCRPRKADGTPLSDEEWKKNPGSSFSGCAWAVGCMGTYIDSAFSDEYCDVPGYTACTSGKVQAYFGALEGINKRLIAGEINEATATKERIEQQVIVNKGIEACRAH